MSEAMTRPALATLRMVKVTDAPALAALMTPAISARLARWHALTDADDAENRIHEALYWSDQGRCMPLVVTAKDDGPVIGWVSVAMSENAPGVALLTYWLGEAFHGRGLLGPLLPRALTMARRMLPGLADVQAAVQPDNAASIAVLHRLGAERIGEGTIDATARGRVERCEYWRVR
jgi:RimJ/RimL family protein N-acetyltransferase